jgi:hypothetical protein
MKASRFTSIGPVSTYAKCIVALKVLISQCLKHEWFSYAVLLGRYGIIDS